MLEEGEVDEGPAQVSRFVHVSPQGGTVAALTGQDTGAGAAAHGGEAALPRERRAGRVGAVWFHDPPVRRRGGGSYRKKTAA